ncbi:MULTISPECIES: Type 1 glutamine amidotransferase-like domain-containing protein [unclassified Mycobacterium]|uniref:Type 1 glutamine amidotransferase-like domain-containing protein n=1 Tax=unclassified Mycobacterium TaxID=2642494 RepID=UPI0006DCFF0C|nr:MULTISPECIES: Type 1 glutamine amidotransferase-like domain-containing protein [unclassified Mycobacterium]
MTDTVPQQQPLYLLADSQLLFWKRRDRLILDTALNGLSCGTTVTAAYIGASNGDRPEYYEIFEAAMDAVGITDRRMIASSFSPQDRAYLENAALIVLAGGDVRLGWNTFERTGMKEVILDRHANEAVLVGISAGAVQLGRYAIADPPESAVPERLDGFDLVPMAIDVHDERAGWGRLSRTIEDLNGAAAGLGIPSGGGVIAHADGTIEPLRRPARKFVFDGASVVASTVPAA